MKKLLIFISAAAIVSAAAAGIFLISKVNTSKPVISETGDVYSSLSTKKIGWGIKKNKNSAPDVPEKINELLREYDSYFMDTRGGKKLYLTFDEGYENGYTGQILDTLKSYDVKAAFFVTKPYIERETELVKRMAAEGHIVGNHTMNHPDMAGLSAEKIKNELNGLNKLYSELIGGNMKYMRPPEGSFSEHTLAVARDLGYKTIFWSFAYRDWDVKSFKGADYAYSQTTPYLHDGAIILLHAVSRDNAEALPQIINYALGEGYRFCSLDELSY